MRWRRAVVVVIFAGILIFFFARRQFYSTDGDFTEPFLPGDRLTAEIVSTLENYVADTMRDFDVPGVAMALVQGDRVVYAKGLGVSDLETKEPVTENTRMVIGSSTKTMTAVMIGTMVDEGLITWDTPVTEIWPDFALSDPELSAALTVKHLLCMCTGVPRRMEEITVQYSELTPESIIESLAGIPLVGKFEKNFNYSSRMLAAAGFLAAMLDGAEYGRLEAGYRETMEKRILGPLQMTASTFSSAEAVASKTSATPYFTGLDGFEAVPVEREDIFRPIAPAGALWSTAADMSRYLLMLVNDGISPEAGRLISEQSLQALWTPQVRIDALNQYGLGWHIEDFHGLQVFHHPGGTAGFAAELVVIPEYDIGFVLLTNRLDLITPIGRMATYRLLELLAGRTQNYHNSIVKSRTEVENQVRERSLLTQKTVDENTIGPFLGIYENETLGQVELILHPDRSVWLDVGEYEIPIRQLRSANNQFILYTSIFVGKTLTLEMDSAGDPFLSLVGDEAKYTFTR